MRRLALRLVLAVLLPLAVCSCAGRTAPVPDLMLEAGPSEYVEWDPDDIDGPSYVLFYTTATDTVPTPADLPTADTCEGEFYVTGQGEDVALWLASGGAWVKVTPQEEDR